jgi:hypothetical protein
MAVIGPSEAGVLQAREPSTVMRLAAAVDFVALPTMDLLLARA